MSVGNYLRVGGAIALMLSTPMLHAEEGNASGQSLEEVRNTVINLLKALVDKGLLTREQAEQMVKQAQQKATADAAAAAAKNAATAEEDKGAVSVPYVPQIVKDDISKQVAEEVRPAVVADVVQQAKKERWGVPEALPEWLSRVRVFGELTVRGQTDLFADDNSNQIFDYQAINLAGGVAKATYPFLNTTENRYRMRLRGRIGVAADLTPNLHAAIRLSSGSLTDPSSASQTLGTYGGRYTVGVDQAYLAWDSSPSDRLSLASVSGGRVVNPWFSPTELVYGRDLTFEGVSGTLRYRWGSGTADRANVYVTIGGFPMLEVPQANSENKWLVGGQIGTSLPFREASDHLRFAVAYYDFMNVTGQRNDPESTLLNFTAPAFVRNGNSMFDISNTVDPSVNLFGLAAHFRLVDIGTSYELGLGSRSLTFSGEAVRNIGYNRNEVEALTGKLQPSDENTGYVGEFSFGDRLVDRLGKWRVAVGYRYVKRDAVLDAWTDADFHEGGTNARGYYLWGSYGIAPRTWVRLRYLSGNEIDGDRYAVDIMQLDVTAAF
ncbi:MAG TPA: putative porin [Steroidobacteraceae bacterium]|nr:putative porin [Steroidobacteraceae bacterium]